MEPMSPALVSRSSESPGKPWDSFFILENTLLGFLEYDMEIPAPFLKSFPMAQSVKNLPEMQETWVQSLGQKDPLEKEVATHCSIFSWEEI